MWTLWNQRAAGVLWYNWRAGSNKAREFGEIVAATVLAGELSLVGALAAGHLARAHQELGRG